jgi:hypothetical protein
MDNRNSALGKREHDPTQAYWNSLGLTRTKSYEKKPTLAGIGLSEPELAGGGLGERFPKPLFLVGAVLSRIIVLTVIQA